MRLTDIADTEQLFRITQSLPNTLQSFPEQYEGQQKWLPIQDQVLHYGNHELGKSVIGKWCLLPAIYLVGAWDRYAALS